MPGADGGGLIQPVTGAIGGPQRGVLVGRQPGAHQPVAAQRGQPVERLGRGLAQRQRRVGGADGQAHFVE